MSESTERAAFEADAAPMGFDLTRQSIAVPEPWAEYADEHTGHRWAGWLARASLAEGKAEPAWQPIETRPMDGTRYLAVCPMGLVRLVRQADPYDRLPIGDEGDRTVWPDLPTHWQPLLSPPSAVQAATSGGTHADQT